MRVAQRALALGSRRSRDRAPSFALAPAAVRASLMASASAGLLLSSSAGLLLSSSVGLLLAGCAKPPAEPAPTAEAVAEPTLAFEEWRKDVLDCAAERCEFFYDIDVPEPGRVRADVYAPLDPGSSEFELSLLDADGEAVARPVDADARPRRLAYLASPGRYRIRVAGVGEPKAPLRFEVVSYFAPDAGAPAKARTKPTVRESKPATKPVAAPAPAPKPDASSANVLMTAEVLGLEREEGGVFVLLEVGSREGVRPQMRGVLRDGTAEVGRFTVVEVYDDGSRARLDGAFEGELAVDATAAILR